MSTKQRDKIAVVFCILISVTAADPDIDCLNSIKESLVDPNGYLSSWNFSNQTIPGFVCSFAGVECWNARENRVLNLELSNFGLKGPFPLGIANCTTLTGLNFSGNALHGSLPADISERLRFVTVLDLSFNNFSGEIPVSIANCSYLNVLKLNNNCLTGRIPGEVGGLRRLKEFSVANNQLSGKIPDFVYVNFSKESYVNNSGLCGGPLPRCPTAYRLQ